MTPRFLTDEDIRGILIHAIRRAEPTLPLETAREHGLGGASDPEILEYAWINEWLVISHDVNTMKAAAEIRIADGPGIRGLFLVKQDRPIPLVVESVRMIWHASEFEEWQDDIAYLPL